MHKILNLPKAVHSFLVYVGQYSRKPVQSAKTQIKI